MITKSNFYARTAFNALVAGVKFVLLAALLYAPGTWLYYYARREQRQRVFTAVEWAVFGAATIAAILALAALASGAIVIQPDPRAAGLPHLPRIDGHASMLWEACT